MNAQPIDIAPQRRQRHINGKVLLDQPGDITERVAAQVELAARRAGGKPVT